MIAAEQLAAVLACPLDRAQRWTKPLADALAAYEINTPARVAAFLAQIGHESGRLLYVRELWGPTKQQLRYERDFEAAWPSTEDDQTNKLAHALGNSERGDGFRYRGRGLIQITGRANYRQVSQALGRGFEAAPDMLERPEFAALSAAWFWRSRGLNELADVGRFEQITRRINGGLNGQAERVALFDAAKAVLA